MRQSELSQLILQHVRQRGAEKSVCPSEVARAIDPQNWRSHMDSVRLVARQLAVQGKIRITQGDQQLDPTRDWLGPIRLRLPQGLVDPLP